MAQSSIDPGTLSTRGEIPNPAIPIKSQLDGKGPQKAPLWQVRKPGLEIVVNQRSKKITSYHAPLPIFQKTVELALHLSLNCFMFWDYMWGTLAKPGGTGQSYSPVHLVESVKIQTCAWEWRDGRLQLRII